MRQPKVMLSVWFLLALFAFSSFLPFLGARTGYAAGPSELPVTPAITVQLGYQMQGIAGPQGADADFYDELPYPAVLVGPDNLVKYWTYTKINIGDSGVDASGNDLPDDTATARWEDVATGTYQACVPLAAPFNVANALCSPEFSYTEGETLPLGFNIGGVGGNTLEIIEAALAFRLNEKPCPGSHIGWIICPIAEQLFETTSSLTLNVLTKILVIDPLDDQADDTSAAAALFDIWNGFRVIASVLFVLIFIAAIFGQGLAGFQLFSAYDFKKIVPRLVISAIGIQLSWYIVGFMIDVFNTAGAGVRGLILAPVDGIDAVTFDTGAIGGYLSTFVATGGLISAWSLAGGALGIIFLIPILLLNVLLALIFGIFILLLRNALVLLVIVTGPVALALWALPNTQKIFSFWWDALWRLLLMYPLIVAFIGFGELAAKVTIAGNEASLAWSLISLMLLFAPLFAIPYTFRIAQNILGSVVSGLDNQRRTISQRAFGSPDDEFSYRSRMRERRGRYQADKQWKRYQKHFIAPGQQAGTGFESRGPLGLLPRPAGSNSPLRWKRARNRGAIGGSRIPFVGRPQLGRKKSGRGDNTVRTSWRPGGWAYDASVGGVHPFRWMSRPGRAGSDLHEKGEKSAYRQETFGEYVASLPRFALRTPGRMRARMGMRWAGAAGQPGIDEVMSHRNKRAEDEMRRMAKNVNRDHFSYAVLGSTINLSNGNILNPEVIQAAQAHLNDPAMVEEHLKRVLDKAGGIPYRRQLVEDFMHGQWHPDLQRERKHNPALDRYMRNIDKAAGFGTKHVWGEGNFRNFTLPMRTPGSSVDYLGRRLEDVPVEDRHKLLAGMGVLTDDGVYEGVQEAFHINDMEKNFTFAPTMPMMLTEAHERMYDMVRMKAHEQTIREVATEEWVEEQMAKDGIPVNMNNRSQWLRKHEKTYQKWREKKIDDFIDKNIDRLRTIRDTRYADHMDMILDLHKLRLAESKDPRERALAQTELQKMEQPFIRRYEYAKTAKEAAKEPWKTNDPELVGRMVFDDAGNPLLTFRAKKDPTGRDFRVDGAHEEIEISDKQLRDLIGVSAAGYERMLDSLTQTDTSADVGDEDSADSVKGTDQQQLQARWQTNRVAESMWIEQETRRLGGTVPDESTIRQWRQQTGPNSRQQFVRDNHDNIMAEKRRRIDRIVHGASTARIAPDALSEWQHTENAMRWVNDESTLRFLEQTGVLREHDSDDILRDR